MGGQDKSLTEAGRGIKKPARMHNTRMGGYVPGRHSISE